MRADDDEIVACPIAAPPILSPCCTIKTLVILWKLLALVALISARYASSDTHFVTLPVPRIQMIHSTPPRSKKSRTFASLHWVISSLTGRSSHMHSACSSSTLAMLPTGAPPSDGGSGA